MDERTNEFQKIISAKKTANKMKENIVKSTMKLYRQKSSPYELVRNKPLKDVELSNSTFSQPLVAINNELTSLLQIKLMNLTEMVHNIRENLIKTQREVYRRKSSPYVWIRPQNDEPKMKNEERKIVPPSSTLATGSRYVWIRPQNDEPKMKNEERKIVPPSMKN